MTMISPIHLLLFGARKIEYINDPVLDDLVVIDDWYVICRIIFIFNV